MIRIHQDEARIAPDVRDAAKQAAIALECTPENERAEFIRGRAHIWRAFRDALSAMSHGKCWYSEALDTHSFYDVDHYRPKLRARRSDREVDTPGYEWLAFDWRNFRYAATRANRPNTNPDSGVVEGKGDWFPLLPNSPKARWVDRCEHEERPVLLDPTVQADVDLVDVDPDGQVVPSPFAVGTGPTRVRESVQRYGLNLPGIRDSRRRVMRQVSEAIAVLQALLDVAGRAEMPQNLADDQPITLQIASIRKFTDPASPFSKAARLTVERANLSFLL